MDYKHLFGPVRSRRLGLSLGIDLTPHKTCSLNCAYCECGRTTDLTLERKNYVPENEIIQEFEHFVQHDGRIDYVTFGGSGEPTLNLAIGNLIRYIKTKYPQYQTALLTNGTLFYRPEVRQEVLPFDLVLPSLDAISDEIFKQVNDAHGGLKNSEIIDGLIRFAHEYEGYIWLEVFIIPGINDTQNELDLFKEIIAKIKPHRIQLNSLDRPGTCEWVKPASIQRLLEIGTFFLSHSLPVEIISRQWSLSTVSPSNIDEAKLLQFISRRPATLEEVAIHLKQLINIVTAKLIELEKSQKIESRRVNNRSFYSLRRN